jgi:hypothetical protein
MKAFFPKADYTKGLGMLVAFILMGLTFMIFHFAYECFKVLVERSKLKQENNTEMVQVANQMLLTNCIWMAVLAIPGAFILMWDLDLFQYRLLLGALGVDTPDAATGLTSLAHQMQENGDLWIWNNLSIDARGYVALVAGMSLLLEISFYKTGDNYTKLWANMGKLVAGKSGDDNPPVFYGYDAEGKPVYDAGQPVVYDVDGNPVTPQASADATASGPIVDEHGQGNQKAGFVNAAGAGAEAPLFSTEEPPKSDAAASTFAPASGCETQRAASTEMDVIGGSTGEKVTLAHAQTNPERYWIDPDTHHIWAVDYRNELLGNSGNKTA